MSPKRMAKYYEEYTNSNNWCLADCYKSYSPRKEVAYETCVNTVLELNGYDLKIINYNIHHFTAGFYFIKNEEKMFAVITKSYLYTIPLNKISVDLEEIFS